MTSRTASLSSPAAQRLVLAEYGRTSVSSRREGVWPWPNFHLGACDFRPTPHSDIPFLISVPTHSFPILSHSPPRMSGVRDGCEGGWNHGYALPIFYTIPLTARRVTGISLPPSTTTSRVGGTISFVRLPQPLPHPKSVWVAPPAKTASTVRHVNPVRSTATPSKVED